MYSSLLKPRTLNFLLAIQTPAGQLRPSPHTVAEMIKHLINCKSDPSVAQKDLIPGVNDLEGYQCLNVELYEQPIKAATEFKSIRPILGDIRVPSLDVGEVPIRPRRMTTIWAKSKKIVLFVLVAFLSIITEHIGLPLLHWVFATLANYVK